MTKTKSIIYCGLFTALIAVGAFIKIPVPVVPFTLQYLFTMLAGLLLGARLGSLSVFAYMVLGLAGLPIFTEGGGLWYVLKPSFGYIIGFVFSALVMWAFEKSFGKKTWALILSMVLALAVCYAFGTVWFMIVYAKNVGAVGLSAVLGWCVIPFIIPDLAKITLAFILSNRISKAVTLS